MTAEEYCRHDIEVNLAVQRSVGLVPLPSLAWLCANPDRWYIWEGRLMFIK